MSRVEGQRVAFTVRRCQLQIVDPCPASWDTMREQGEGKRHCEACDKSVHKLSELTGVMQLKQFSCQR